jgi:hypothetical protein
LLPGAESGVADPREGQPLSGDSHAHLLAPLRAFAQSIGYTVTFTAIAGLSRGWCDSERRQIAIDARMPANAQVRARWCTSACMLSESTTTATRALAPR